MERRSLQSGVAALMKQLFPMPQNMIFNNKDEKATKNAILSCIGTHQNGYPRVTRGPQKVIFENFMLLHFQHFSNAGVGFGVPGALSHDHSSLQYCSESLVLLRDQSQPRSEFRLSLLDKTAPTCNSSQASHITPRQVLRTEGKDSL